jgi:hypothetical protein
MIADLILTVELKSADPVALTAAHALTHRLGYGKTLDELRRLELWRLRVEARGIADALALAGSWVTRSNRFVNPNKHIYELAARGGEAAGSAGTAAGRGGRGANRTAWVVATSEPDLDGEAALRLIHDRFHGRELTEARHAVAWMLRFTQAVDPAEVPRLAQGIAIARARDRGLLANPHFQPVAIVRSLTSPEAAVEIWG